MAPTATTSTRTCTHLNLPQVLHGGENLLDKVEALKARSAATKAELEVAARQQEEQQRRLEQLQLERLDLSAQYSSLEVRGIVPWGSSIGRQGSLE